MEKALGIEKDCVQILVLGSKLYIVHLNTNEIES